MLKSVLEKLLKEANVKVSEFRIDNTKLTAQSHSVTKELEDAREQVKNMTNQMEQISQSVYTMLRVKYPENKPMDLSACAVNTAWTPETEDQRFLMLIHEMCNKRHMTIGDFYPSNIQYRPDHF